MIEVVPLDVLDRWLAKQKMTTLLAILFGGDRRTCLTHCLTVTRSGEQIAFCTIAEHGETGVGDTTIVGLYVLPAFRKQGWGGKLLCRAIDFCLLEQGWSPIQIDAFHTAIGKVICQLPPAVQDRINLNDYYTEFPLLED